MRQKKKVEGWDGENESRWPERGKRVVNAIHLLPTPQPESPFLSLSLCCPIHSHCNLTSFVFMSIHSQPHPPIHPLTSSCEVPSHVCRSLSYTLCELHELLISQLKKYDSGWWLVNILQRPQAEGLGTPKPGASCPRCLLVICRRQHIAFLSFKRFMRRAGQFPWLHCAKNRSLIKNNMLALT